MEPGGFATIHGVIWKHEGGVTSVFCESDPTSAAAPAEMWQQPEEVLADAEGRVVFVATIVHKNANALLAGTAGRFGVRGYGLLRCNSAGAQPEVLALMPSYATDGAVDPGGPMLFPGELVAQGSRSVGGLHLSLQAAVAIDDTVDGGLPHVAGDDRYVLGFALWEPNSGVRDDMRIVGVSARTGDVAEITGVMTHPGFPFEVPHMYNSAGTTYSALRGMIGYAEAGLNLSVTGVSPGSPPFAATGRVTGMLLDDLTVPNTTVPCATGPDAIVPYSAPGSGTYNVLSGLDDVVVHDGSIVATTDSGAVGMPHLVMSDSQLPDLVAGAAPHVLPPARGGLHEPAGAGLRLAHALHEP